MENLYVIAVMSENGHDVERFVNCAGTAKLRALRTRKDARELRAELRADPRFEGRQLKIVQFVNVGTAR